MKQFFHHVQALNLFVCWCVLVSKVQLVAVLDSSDSLLHTTNEDAESVVSCECRDYTYVNCSWQLHPIYAPSDNNTQLSSLQSKYDGGSNQWETVVCKDQANFSVAISQKRNFCYFRPNTKNEYYYKLSTQEDDDEIPFSISQNAHPYPPTNITVQATNDSSILVSWLPPQEWFYPKLKDIEYEIHYVDSDRSQNVTCERGSCQDEGDWISHDTKYKTILLGLDPNTVYNISIVSVRIIGNSYSESYIKSEPSQVYSVRTHEGAYTTTTIRSSTHAIPSQPPKAPTSDISNEFIVVVAIVVLLVALVVILTVFWGHKKITKDSAYDIKDLEYLRNNNLYKNLQFPKQREEDKEQFDEVIVSSDGKFFLAIDTEETPPSQRRYSLEPTSSQLPSPKENTPMVLNQSLWRVPTNNLEIAEDDSQERPHRESEHRLPLLTSDQSVNSSTELSPIPSLHGNSALTVPLESSKHSPRHRISNLSDSSSDCTSASESYVKHGLFFPDGNQNFAEAKEQADGISTSSHSIEDSGYTCMGKQGGKCDNTTSDEHINQMSLDDTALNFDNGESPSTSSRGYVKLDLQQPQNQSEASIELEEHDDTQMRGNLENSQGSEYTQMGVHFDTDQITGYTQMGARSNNNQES